MKKIKIVVVMLLLISLISGCEKKKETTDDLIDPMPTAKNNYYDYISAADDDKIELLMSVQAHEDWNEKYGQGVVTVYGQDDNGGYYCHELVTDEMTANAMTEGTLIRVVGYKNTNSNGEVSLVDSSCEIIVGAYDGVVYDAKDITDKLDNTNELKKYMNQKISISDLKVIESSKNNDSSDPDIFITAMINDKEISLCVESNLTNVNSDTYQIVENLEVGNIIDVEGFLYWNYGPNPRITTITVK